MRSNNVPGTLIKYGDRVYYDGVIIDLLMLLHRHAEQRLWQCYYGELSSPGSEQHQAPADAQFSGRESA